MYRHAVNDMTIFDLMACIINMAGRTDLIKMNQALHSLSGNRLTMTLEFFSHVHSRISNSLENSIKLPYEIAAEILEVSRKRLETNDYGSVGLLLNLLDNAAGPFKKMFSKMGYYTKPWQQVVELPPLNTNFRITGIKLYPIIYPFGADAFPTVIQADLTAPMLKNYFALTVEEELHLAVTIRYFYMINSVFQNKIEQQRHLSIALSPLSGTDRSCAERPVSESRFLQTFRQALDQDCQIIAFPRALGNQDLISRMQNELTAQPDKTVLVLPPAFYANGRTKTILLGPGGCILHKQDNIIPLSSCVRERPAEEQDISRNILNILLIEGLGSVMTPACQHYLRANHSILVLNSLAVRTGECQSACQGTCSGGFCYFHIILDYNSLKISCTHKIA